jgi:hypothetical protein
MVCDILNFNKTGNSIESSVVGRLTPYEPGLKVMRAGKIRE